ncbi:MAG: GatB/YqeY domain-containing protein [Acidimicrobiales bacterium]
MLIDDIRRDLTTAMRARDQLRLRTLRAVVAAVQEAQVAGVRAETLSDDEVRAVIAAQVKRRVEAAEAFDQAGRNDKAADERDEQAVLESYLPARLAEEELATLVDATLAAGGWTSRSDMGPAMKAVTAEVAGRADGRAVAELVKARLA